MKQLMEAEERCVEGAQRLFGILPMELGSNYEATYYDNAVIHVMITGTQHGLSVYYPADANMNRANGLVIETALLNANRVVVYNSEFDYEDVRRWYNIEELVAEFNRVRALLI